MKHPLLLIALAAATAGGCQQAAHSGHEFADGMSRTNFAVGFGSAQADGAAFTSVANSGGAPLNSLDGQLSDITVAESSSLALAASHSTFVSDQVELGARIGLGSASNDSLTVTDTDYDGNGFDDRAAAGGVTAEEDQTYYQVGGFTRWYPAAMRWGSLAPWAQFDFGYYLGDLSGLYYGGSLGASY
ncbi:MAG: hypothetical protein MK209_08940, partial [Planctomycetes bacterium]|nr:hypothetical protein [Planctomycetota bacterium]